MEINSFITQYNKEVVKNKKNEWIVIHYTANDGDTAKGNCNYFSKPLPKEKRASANYFVDEKYIWQCVEDECIAWHVGAKTYYNDCRNANSIGIELCSRINKKTGEYYIKEETIRNAQILTAYLMERYNIKLDHVCRHYDVTRKVCPAPFVRHPEQWESFKAGIEWIDDLLYLKEQGRLNGADRWVLKNYEQDGEIKYLIKKWAKDVKALTN